MIRFQSWTAYLALAGIALAFALALLAPSASDELAFGARLLFWLLHVSAALSCLVGAQLAIARAPRVGDAAGWAQVALAGVVGALFFAPLALGLDALFVEIGLEEEEAETLLGQLVEEIGWTAPPVILLWLLLNAPRLVAIAPSERMGEPDPAEAFWAKLPRKLGRDLIALTAELHYLRVYTTQGEALILFNISRADELLGERGMRAHRSHWIVPGRVRELKSDNGRLTAVMENGLAVPVSRPNRPTLRKALKS